jgi:FtsP/CotA-like multicopper oxidase with cupredoxin domain
LLLQARASAVALRPGGPDTQVWSLQAQVAGQVRRGDELEITFQNNLPVPTVLNWHGIDGVPAVEPLTTCSPLVPGGTENLVIPMRHAGTLMTDLRLLGDGAAQPSPVWALAVQENEPVGVDRDELLLFQDWRLRPDGSAIAPGTEPKDTMPLYTINGQTTVDIPARINERLRLRFVNGFQRNIIAVKIENHDVRVMAIDGQPAEPFVARGSIFVLAPGTRIDAFVDATAPSGSTSSILLHDGTEARPIARLVTSNDPPIRNEPLAAPLALPSNGLPAQIDLKNALRFELTLGGLQTEWVTPATFSNAAAPAFRARSGRAVVLALTNRAETTIIFRLHGHHFRLLDRLDDGWKPFWLDTLTIESGQTQRIAFAAEHTGRWLVEATPTAWAAPRLVQWYAVE